jgi:serine/threonine protein kinase
MNENSKLFTSKGLIVQEDDVPFLKHDEDLYYSPKGAEFEYKQTINNYKKIRLLGKGGCGKVYLAENKETKELIALKYMNIKGFIKGADKVKEIYREA